LRLNVRPGSNRSNVQSCFAQSWTNRRRFVEPSSQTDLRFLHGISRIYVEQPARRSFSFKNSSSQHFRRRRINGTAHYGNRSPVLKQIPAVRESTCPSGARPPTQMEGFRRAAGWLTSISNDESLSWTLLWNWTKQDAKSARSANVNRIQGCLHHPSILMLRIEISYRRGNFAIQLSRTIQSASDVLCVVYRCSNPRCKATMTACVRSLTSSRSRITLTWHFTVASVMPSGAADLLVALPARHQRKLLRALAESTRVGSAIGQVADGGAEISIPECPRKDHEVSCDMPLIDIQRACAMLMNVSSLMVVSTNALC